MSASGQKQTYAVQKSMSALPPKTDMCSALAHVRFRPKADISNILFDYFVGAGDQAWWHCDSQRLGGLHIDRHLEFGWRLHARANVEIARSISPASRTLTGVNSTPNDGATDWMAPNCPVPAAMAGSRRTATRVTLGAISLRSSSHFAPMLNSNKTKPVALPPGRARLSTKPAPTGSIVPANTIGTVRVTACNAATVGLAVARMTSGVSVTNSVANLRSSAASPAVQRTSIRTF